MNTRLIETDLENHQQNLRLCGQLVHGYDVGETFGRWPG